MVIKITNSVLSEQVDFHPSKLNFESLLEIGNLG